MVSVDNIEFKNIPEKFLNKYLVLKAELKLEKINHGKCQSYIHELKDSLDKLEKKYYSRSREFDIETKKLLSEVMNLKKANKNHKKTIKELKNKYYEK